MLPCSWKRLYLLLLVLMSTALLDAGDQLVEYLAHAGAGGASPSAAPHVAVHAAP